MSTIVTPDQQKVFEEAARTLCKLISEKGIDKLLEDLKDKDTEGILRQLTSLQNS